MGKLKLRENQIPCLGLTNAWTGGEAWFRTLKKKARNNFTRGRRILTELGGDVDFRIVNAADPQAEPYWSACWRSSGTGWKKTNRAHRSWVALATACGRC